MYNTCIQLLGHVNSLQFKQYLEADSIQDPANRPGLEKELDPSLIHEPETQTSLVKNLDLLKNKVFNFKFSNKA